jgi:hypothetical protein
MDNFEFKTHTPPKSKALLKKRDKAFQPKVQYQISKYWTRVGRRNSKQCHKPN